jgi:uncharacterized protein (DUF3084 family)
MSIEERLEALTQTLELTASMQQVNEREISQLSKEIGQLRQLAAQDGENIRSLARIAEAHERRLDDLEGH